MHILVTTNSVYLLNNYSFFFLLMLEGLFTNTIFFMFLSWNWQTKHIEYSLCCNFHQSYAQKRTELKMCSVSVNDKTAEFCLYEQVQHVCGKRCTTFDIYCTNTTQNSFRWISIIYEIFFLDIIIDMTKCCGIIILRSITLHSHEFWVYRLFHGKYKCCNGIKKK